ncbi:MAG: amidohydrolase family protein [Planctomycetes bacterium]|nr:amidohydrolase family protein [Planctomycetota bacterium]
MIQRCRILTAVSTVALLAVAVAAEERFAIRAAAHVDASGELRQGALIVIENGLIASVNADVASIGDIRVDTFEGAVVSPGLIDVHAGLGADGQLSERQSAIQPDVVAGDAFDRFHRQFRMALRAGVTSVGLSPDDANLVGGRIAICKTSGSGGAPYVLGDGPMKLSLAADVLRRDRKPTSRGGAIAMLRGAIGAARESKDGSPMAALASGGLSAFVTAPSGADVLSILRMASDYGLKLTLIHQYDAHAIGDAIAAAKVGVIVGPYGFRDSRRSVGAAGILEKRGITIAIAGGLPGASADSLRLGAAMAARGGLSLAAARRAITSAPAEFLGVSDRIGSIAEGRDADLVIFSGDPLDLRSRVLAVYVDGRRVYTADSRE